MLLPCPRPSCSHNQAREQEQAPVVAREGEAGGPRSEEARPRRESKEFVARPAEGGRDRVHRRRTARGPRPKGRARCAPDWCDPEGQAQRRNRDPPVPSCMEHEMGRGAEQGGCQQGELSHFRSTFAHVCSNLPHVTDSRSLGAIEDAAQAEWMGPDSVHRDPGIQEGPRPPVDGHGHPLPHLGRNR